MLQKIKKSSLEWKTHNEMETIAFYLPTKMYKFDFYHNDNQKFLSLLPVVQLNQWKLHVINDLQKITFIKNLYTLENQSEKMTHAWSIHKCWRQMLSIILYNQMPCFLVVVVAHAFTVMMITYDVHKWRIH